MRVLRREHSLRVWCECSVSGELTFESEDLVPNGKASLQECEKREPEKIHEAICKLCVHTQKLHVHRTFKIKELHRY